VRYSLKHSFLLFIRIRHILFKQAVEFAGDVNALPQSCIKIADPVVDKTALKKLLKSGTEVKGARLVARQNLQIK